VTPWNTPYGLYTHIQSNRRRSIALLIGLFLPRLRDGCMAGALVAEASMYDASVEWLLRKAWREHDLRGTVRKPSARRCGSGSPTGSIRRWSTMVTGARDVTREEEPRLYNLLENLCISRGHHDAEAQDHGDEAHSTPSPAV